MWCKTQNCRYICTSMIKSGGLFVCYTFGLNCFWFPCILTVKPSKPRCWMDGKLLEGSDVKLSCKSSDGSDPISYKWERVLDKGKSLGKLPNLALIGKKKNWHYSDMLIHHPVPCREMLWGFIFILVIFIGCIYRGKCFAEHTTFSVTSSHLYIHIFENTDT